MSLFRFKQFDVDDMGCGMKVCSDSVLFGAWFFSRYPDAENIIDIGAGSGVLSLLAAQLCKGARITGLELDNGAYEASAINFKNSPWPDRLDVKEGDFLKYEPVTEVDIIVSNPPFFTNGEKSCDRERALARHQESLTFETLIDYSSRHLNKTGHLGIITPAEHADDIIFYAEMKGLKLISRIDVYPVHGKKSNRILWDFSKTDAPLEVRSLCVRNADGSYTDEYLALVENLYLKI